VTATNKTNKIKNDLRIKVIVSISWLIETVKVFKTSGILEGQKLKTPEKLVQTNVFSPLFTQILGFLPHFLGV
jgi:hypothetical protein